MEKEAKKDNGSDIEPSSIEDIALHSEKKENKVLQFKEDITMQDMFLRRTGRLNRLRYFKRSLVVAAANIIASVAIEAMFMDKWGNTNSTGEFIQVIAAILLLIPSYLLDVRRLQDINQGPALAIVGTIMAFILLTAQDTAIITLTGIVIMAINLYLLFREGTRGTNPYGTDPLEHMKKF